MSDNVTDSARAAGDVERYHTWPTVRRQTVADHSYHVLRVYTETFGAPEPCVTRFVLYHDSGEVATGDPPFPIKRDNPVLKSEVDRLERIALREMGAGEHDRDVGPYEKIRVKVCDLLEMLEFGLTETELGNRHAWPIVDRTREAVQEFCRSKDLTKADREAVGEFLNRTLVRHRKIMRSAE